MTDVMFDPSQFDPEELEAGIEVFLTIAYDAIDEGADPAEVVTILGVVLKGLIEEFFESHAIH
jgi:hypothetical protein